MAWSNSALEKYFKENKGRINSISLNNGKYLFLGVKGGPTEDDIEFITFNGVELIRVHHERMNGDKKVKWTNDLTTEFIEGIDVLDKVNPDVMLDPLTLK